MKAWVLLEEYIPTILEGWKRKKKKHYGDSTWDVEGDGYKGGAKHYKRFSIHTISDEENQKYKDDVVLFTKEKKKHYVPENIRVTINLKQFAYLLHCKRKAEKMPSPKLKTKPSNEIMYKIRAVRQLFKEIEKMVKSKGG